MVALANVALTDTFDTWRIRTNQVIIKGNEEEIRVTNAYDRANATGAGANAFTSATVAGANAAVGAGANVFTSATVAGANTAVGAGANAFTSATVAGANTAVGAGANAFTVFTISGANTAVGDGANSYATTVGISANAFTSATIAGANAFTSATVAGANTAVGAGANAFTSATVSGANTITIAAFAKANASVQNNSTTLITTGYSVSTYNAGANVAAYSTWTPDPANSNYQYATSNGAFTLAAPTNNCAIDILLTNGVNAKSITFSGFTVDANNVGDVYNTTNTNRFIIMIRKINNVSTYIIKALQA
jgi:hypothetical protein